MRNTERAEDFYRKVRHFAMLRDDDAALWVPTCDGHIALAHAIRDIYDKLETIERKVDTKGVAAQMRPAAGRL